MKKYFNTKTLILVLSLLLIFGITVFAADDSATTPSPDIAIYNVKYGDTFKLQVAVKDASVPAGETVTVNVYGEYPTENSTVLDTFTLTRTSIAQFDGAYFYVGTSKRAVSASALATEFYMQAQYGEDDATVKGNVAKYSVAEYLYEKLYLENYVAKTEEDGKDYIRKTFYEGILVFGAGAQHLFDNTAPEYYMDKLSYCVVEDGTVNGKVALLANPDTELTITYAGKENVKYLTSWIYTSLEGGESAEYAVDENKLLTIAAPAEAFKLTPVFKNPYVIDFENGTLSDEAGSISVNNEPTDSGLTVGIVSNPTDSSDNVYGIVGTPSGNKHFRVTLTDSNTTGNTYKFEAQMYISSEGAVSKIAFGTLDFRNASKSTYLYGVNLAYNGQDPITGINVQKNLDSSNLAAFPIDRWFKLEMVSVYYEENGVSTVDSYIYVDGNLVASQIGLTKYGSGSTPVTNNALSFNLKVNKNVKVAIYLDDIMFTRTQSED